MTLEEKQIHLKKAFMRDAEYLRKVARDVRKTFGDADKLKALEQKFPKVCFDYVEWSEDCIVRLVYGWVDVFVRKDGINEYGICNAWFAYFECESYEDFVREVVEYEFGEESIAMCEKEYAYFGMNMWD